MRRSPALTIGLVVLAVAIVRLLVARPTFLHANFHGGSLVEAILDYPAHATGREATYGRFGFALLGLVARLLGRRFEVITAANQLFGAATLLVMAWMAWRWSGDRGSAFATLALGALHLALVRVAASEDAHTLAVLLGWLAFLGFDLWAERRGLAALLGGTVALVLMINTRQTLYVFVPCAYGLALARGGRSLWRRPELAASIALVLGALAWRAVTTLGTSSEQVSFVVIGLILSTPRLVLTILAHHPLLDVVRFGPFPTVLLLIGLVSAWRARGARRAAVLSFALSFVVSLPTAWHTPGVELAFRLPAMSFALVLAGLGWGWLAARLRDRRPGLPQPGFLLAIGLFPLILPSFRELRQQSADCLEYLEVRRLAASWPGRLVLVDLPPTSMMPSYRPPVGLLRRSGIEVVRPRDEQAIGLPRVFFAGVQCWAWSMGELLGLGDDPSKIDRASLARWGVATVRGDLRDLALPRGRRPECDRLLAGARPLGAPGSIDHPVQDPPFVLYGVDAIPVQLYQLADR
jgi:hypothetical protein